MSDEINFVDIMALSKIGPDTVVEKFGGMINSSFFDASNILGALKIKGLIDFTTSFPGQSAITVTELGKQTMNDANGKSNEPFDTLDFTLLSQLSAGKRSLTDLSGAVNIRPKDMAMHLYKLMQLQYLTSTFRNGVLDIALTEKGFLQVKAGMPKPQPTPQASAAVQVQPGQAQGEPAFAPEPQPMAAQQPAINQTPPEQNQPQKPVNEVEKLISESRLKKAKKNTIIIVIIVLIIILLAVLFKYKIL